jgi:hypothetical protein
MRSALVKRFFPPFLDRPVGNLVLYHTQVKPDFFVMMFECRKDSGCAMSVWQGLAMLGTGYAFSKSVTEMSHWSFKI